MGSARELVLVLEWFIIVTLLRHSEKLLFTVISYCTQEYHQTIYKYNRECKEKSTKMENIVSSIKA